MGVTKWRFSNSLSRGGANPFGSICPSLQNEASHLIGCLADPAKRKGPDSESGPRRAFWDRLNQATLKEIALEVPDCKHTILDSQLFEQGA
jgi:hypothetical protein